MMFALAFVCNCFVSDIVFTLTWPRSLIHTGLALQGVAVVWPSDYSRRYPPPKKNLIVIASAAALSAFALSVVCCQACRRICVHDLSIHSSNHAFAFSTAAFSALLILFFPSGSALKAFWSFAFASALHHRAKQVMHFQCPWFTSTLWT